MMILKFTCVSAIFSLCFCGMIDDPNCIYPDNVTAVCNLIPMDILPGITRVMVRGMNFVNNAMSVKIKQANFSSHNWAKVEYLEISDFKQNLNGHWSFENDCFSSLGSLAELHIHAVYLNIFQDTFTGLDNVTVLDLSECARLYREMLLTALNGTGKLPRLRKLLLRNWNSYHAPYDFDKTFVEILLPRRITHLDISSTHVSLLDLNVLFKKLKNLEVLNMSYANVEEMLGLNVSFHDLRKFRVFDQSHSIWPKQLMPLLPAVITISNVNLESSTYSWLESLLAAETLNISGIFPYYSTIYVENVRFTINEKEHWSTKNLVFRQNNFKRVDVNCRCEQYFFSVENFDISDNGLEFIHPSILHCMQNLERIDLSQNQLFKMVKENITLFEKLFWKLANLKIIQLSANGLQDIPLHTFSNSRNVKIIDLSNNRLGQITFILNDIDRLEILDLQKNNIKVLDQRSLIHLNFVWKVNTTNELHSEINLYSNPLSCSECMSKLSIERLLRNMQSGLVKPGLFCSNENGNQEIITESTVAGVNKICNRKIVLISSVLSSGAFVTLVIIISLFMYKRRKRQKKVRERAEIIDLLKQGQGQYEFMVFLSFSSDDEEFVYRNILQQLDEYLRRITGIDRTLVCTGDIYFRPGAYVYDEIERCLAASSVVMLVISNTFCTSEYCCKELDQAFIKGKPILPMFIEDVGIEKMTERIKKVFDNNVRLLWTRDEDGEQVLKTTWENVCESLLDLIRK